MRVWWSSSKKTIFNGLGIPLLAQVFSACKKICGRRAFSQRSAGLAVQNVWKVNIDLLLIILGFFVCRSDVEQPGFWQLRKNKTSLLKSRNVNGVSDGGACEMTDGRGPEQFELKKICTNESRLRCIHVESNASRRYDKRNEEDGSNWNIFQWIFFRTLFLL